MWMCSYRVRLCRCEHVTQYGCVQDMQRTWMNMMQCGCVHMMQCGCVHVTQCGYVQGMECGCIVTQCGCVYVNAVWVCSCHGMVVFISCSADMFMSMQCGCIHVMVWLFLYHAAWMCSCHVFVVCNVYKLHVHIMQCGYIQSNGSNPYIISSKCLTQYCCKISMQCHVDAV